MGEYDWDTSFLNSLPELNLPDDWYSAFDTGDIPGVDFYNVLQSAQLPSYDLGSLSFNDVPEGMPVNPDLLSEPGLWDRLLAAFSNMPGNIADQAVGAAEDPSKALPIALMLTGGLGWLGNQVFGTSPGSQFSKNIPSSNKAAAQAGANAAANFNPYTGGGIPAIQDYLTRYMTNMQQKWHKALGSGYNLTQSHQDAMKNAANLAGNMISKEFVDNTAGYQNLGAGNAAFLNPYETQAKLAASQNKDTNDLFGKLLGLGAYGTFGVKPSGIRTAT